MRAVWSAVGAVTGVGLLLLACAKGEDAVLGPGLDGGGSSSGRDPNSGVTNPGAADDDDDTTSSSSGSSGTPKTDGGADGGSSSGSVTTACATALAKAAWDFEASDEGWTHAPSDGTDEAEWPFDPWTRGQDSNNFPCPNGNCWGAEINENYAQCSRGELVSPTFDLSACAGQSVKLQFAHAYVFWTGEFNNATYFDGGIVELSSDGGTTWSVPPGTYPGNLKILTDRLDGNACVDNPFHTDAKPAFVGTQRAASTFAVAVPAAMLTNQARIRFSTGAGVSTDETDVARAGTGAGWRIDDVKIVGGP